MITFVLMTSLNVLHMFNALNKLLSVAGQAIAELQSQIAHQLFIVLKRFQFYVKMEVAIRIQMNAK